MFRKSITLYAAIAAALFGSSTLFATPEISVDSVNFDAGIIREGAQKSLKHAFKVKNTGTDNLIISKVKPGCGCTAVGHDSLILPGKEGIVTAEINLTSFKAGTLRKYITIYSNSKKNPELAISLGCTIRSDLSIEPSYIRIVPAKGGVLSHSFTVTSNKADLAVTEVSFKPNDQSGGATKAAWQAELPIIFNAKLTKTDKVLPDNFFEFKLDITLTLSEPDPKYGTFTFKTNYPGKETITLTGMVDIVN